MRTRRTCTRWRTRCTATCLSRWKVSASLSGQFSHLRTQWSKK